MKAVKSDLKTALTTKDGKAASRFHSTFHINSGLSGKACGAAAPVGISPGAKQINITNKHLRVPALNKRKIIETN
jgi:hypothetical protein